MSAANWVGRSIGGRYQIDALLGQGGMSAVYRAVDPNLRRTVAVKLIHPHLSSDPEFVRRFEQEAAAVAQLRHSNIIQVYDFDHDQEVYYMVLEFVAGETLQSRLKALHAADARLPLSEAVSIMATICDAVEYAHRRGMIHRDLKPANVMLDPQGQPILMDFGVAKMVGGQQHTATGAIIGTVAYMSPEQIRGAHVDERADIYSLGIMLYEMTAGRPPFEGDSAMTVMFKHVNEPPPDIHQYNADVPNALTSVIDKALAKEPDQRYQTAAEMAAALRALNLGAPTAWRTQAAGASATASVSAPGAGPATLGGAGASTTAPVVEPTTTPPAGAGRAPGRPGLTTWLIVGGIGAVVVLGAVALLAWRFLSGVFGGRPPDAQGMIHVDGGVYLVGVEAGDEGHAPQQQVKLSEFYIDQLEVTNALYGQFMKATGAKAPLGWTNDAIPPGQDKRPVQGVTWNQANAYCQWLHKRLPTEAEWEVAARGPNGLLYPWGNNERSVTLPRDGTYDVGSIDANRSYFGVFDMAGNVWEWVEEPYVAVPAGQQVLRGGAYNFLKDMAYRLVGQIDLPTMIADAGFRCAAPQVGGTPVVETAPPVATEPLTGVLYIDEFSNPNSGWPVGGTDTTTFGYHPQSFYHLEMAAPNQTLLVTRQLGFANYLAETAVLVDHTNTTTGDFFYGLALRRTGDNYYAFLISSRTKAWRVELHSGGAVQVLAQGSEDSIQGGKAINELKVGANGQSFSFMINDKVVAEFTDAALSAGEVGFIVQTLDETLAHVHFAALILHEVSQPQTAASATPRPATAAPTVAPSATAPATRAAPTPTATAAATAAPTVTPSATPAPVPAGMVLISAGSFNMGSDTGGSDEKPVHAVSVSAFLMDEVEVTNERYQKCVDAGACTPPANRGSFTRAGYYTSPDFANFPVVQVSWTQAQAFCAWEGKRLPTEAEWEYAARGPGDLRFPWGNDFDPLRVPATVRDTVEVGSLNNASGFGVKDLSGNVNEWVADWYSRTFYGVSPTQDPTGPASGSRRVYRGGSFDNTDGSFYTTTRRYNQLPGFHDADIGFRCAQSLP